jgi:hypothetical protein
MASRASAVGRPGGRFAQFKLVLLGIFYSTISICSILTPSQASLLLERSAQLSLLAEFPRASHLVLILFLELTCPSIR